ncbi:unnamed protein product, partial [Didymodactylos carnosus]
MAGEQQPNFEDFLVAWLDTNIEKPDTLCDRKTQLSSIINRVKQFDNPVDCINYISTIDEEQIFLITSGALGETTVPLVHDCSSVVCIYIYCSYKEKHENWTKRFAKIREVCVDREILLKRLISDVTLYSKALSAPISLFKHEDREYSVRNLSKESAMFMWFQLLFDTLLDSKQTEDSKNEMLTICEEQYKDNEIELIKISEFRHQYSAETAIKWYTRDCFLYRLLNKALRTQNIDFIFSYRFFIIDLYNALLKLYSLPSSVKVINVYRGQMIGVEELQKLQDNVGGFISINTFLSTTKDCGVASDFSGNGGGRPFFESIVYDIQVVEGNSTTKPFAEIQSLSYIEDESEVLFSVGTVFKIESVEQVTDKLWYVKLILSSEGNEQLKEVTRYLRSEIDERPTLITLGNFLSEMGDYDRAAKYYTMLLRELEAGNSEDVGAVLCAIGSLYFRKGEYKQSLEYHEKALEKLATLPEVHPDLATAFNSIGMVYYELNKFDVAMIYYLKALEVHKRVLSDTNDPFISADLNNIALVQIQTGHIQEALENLEKTLQMRLLILPADHPLLSHTYLNMGSLYSKVKDYSSALKMYDNALKIQLKTLPLTHPDLAKTYVNTAQIYSSQREYSKALELNQNALDIQLAMTPLNNRDLSNTYRNMAMVYVNTEDQLSALQTYSKALQLEQTCQPVDIEVVSAIHNNIGTIYFKNNDNERALEHFTDALNVLPSDHPNRFMTFNNIATVHFNSGNYLLSLECYQKVIDSLDFPRITGDLATIYNNVGLIYLMTEQNDLAIEN